MTLPWPLLGTPLAQVMTPMPVIDEDRLESNIAKAQGFMDAHGLAFRPHIKTHKIIEVARAQIAAGAVGISAGSPTPFAPKGPVGSADSTMIGTTSGMSFAVGM